MSVYRYPWPASALTPEDMARLHAVRESCHPRVPITTLIARAIRTQYEQVTETAQPEPTPVSHSERKTAA